MSNYYDHMRLDSKNGAPRLRGLQISVQQVLDLLSRGVTEQQILEQCPGMKAADIRACLAYAAQLPKENSLDQIIRELERTSRRLNWGGFILFAVALLLGIYLYLDIRHKTLEHIMAFLTPNQNNPVESLYPRLIYLVIRGSALGVIATTVIVFCVKTAVACFDQSARFLKRRNGARFLKYLFENFSHEKLEEKVKLEDIRKFFESWNQTVESAFSSVKVDKKASGSMEVSLTKEGAMAKLDDREK